MTKIDIAILTVIGPELHALRKALAIDDKDRITEDGSIYYKASVKSRYSQRELSVLVHGIGEPANAASASATSRIIDRWKPCVVVLMGIAAGRRDECRIGDVIVPRAIVDVTINAFENGQMHGRPSITDLPHPMRQMLTAHELEKEKWHNGFHSVFTDTIVVPEGKEEEYRKYVAFAPKLIDAAIYSEDVLHRDPNRLEHAAQHLHQQIKAGEMEAAGFVRAANQKLPPTPWFVVRGVSDFGDVFKNDLFHKLASCAAASYLAYFLENVYDANLIDSAGSGGKGPDPPRIFDVPERRYFTGREAELTALHTAFHNDAVEARRQVVVGLGGMGKTHFAREYCYRYRSEYEAVLWMPAGTLAELENGFAKAAQVLGLRDKDHLDIKERIRAARAWFAENTNYLLVLDDVTDFSVFEKDMLRFGMRGKLLITTRIQDQAVIGVPKPFELWSLSADDAAGLLLHRSERSDDSANRADAIRLVEALGCLPLAIEQASAYLHWHPSCSITDFLGDFQKRKLAVFEIGSNEDARENVRTTWDISIAEIGKKHPFAKGLMTLSSFLAPDDIPEEFAKYYFPVKGASEKALDVLQRYSLVHRGELQLFYSIHRLLQECVLMPIKDETKKGYFQTAVDNLLKLFVGFEQETEKDCEILLPHVSVCADHIRNYSMRSRSVWKLLYKASVYLSDQARYATAEPLLDQLLGGMEEVQANRQDIEKIKRYQAEAHRSKTLADTLMEDDPLEMARELNNLAGSYQDQGHPSDALPLFERSLSIFESVLNPDHPDVAASLNNLAMLYDNMGRPVDALPLLERSLSISERVLGSEHPDVAANLNNLAGLYNSMGRPADALSLLERSLSINERVLGSEHPDVAQSLNNLAGLYNSMGRPADALPLYLRSLSIREEALGSDHPGVATSLNNLAMLYDNMGRPVDALPLLERSLSISERVLGSEHPNVAANLNNLAGLYNSMGRPADALPLYLRSLSINERVLGSEHPDVAQSLNNLAGLYRSIGRPADALPLYERALAIDEKSLGEYHPSTIRIRANLTVLQEQMAGN